MGKYYFLTLRDAPDAPVAHGVDDPDRDALLAEPGRVVGWPGLQLSCAGELVDYLANDVGVRLCSTPLRAVVDQAQASEAIQWLPASVVDGNGREHAYHVLHLSEVPDVLDRALTLWVGEDFVVKPVVSRSKAAPHQIFGVPGGGRLIVADAVRRAVQARALTGIDFERVAETD